MHAAGAVLLAYFLRTIRPDVFTLSGFV